MREVQRPGAITLDRERNPTATNPPTALVSGVEKYQFKSKNDKKKKNLELISPPTPHNKLLLEQAKRDLNVGVRQEILFPVR